MCFELKSSWVDSVVLGFGVGQEGWLLEEENSGVSQGNQVGGWGRGVALVQAGRGRIQL